MNITEKIAIIPDTNYFYIDEKKKKDFSELKLPKYHKLVKNFEYLEIDSEIFIPELVLCELLFQYKQDLEKEIRTYNKLKNKLNNLMPMKDFDIDINKHVKQLKERYDNEFKIIKIPDDRSMLFNQILMMALNKDPPFSRDDKSDKGFKDSIILLSLFEFAKNTHYDKYILISEDKGFKNNIKEIQKKFCDICHHNSEKLEIVDSNVFENWFNTQYGVYEDLRKVINEKLVPEILFNYNRNAHVEIRYNNYFINACDLIKEQTKIYQESENIFEVELYFSINLNFEDFHQDELWEIESMEIINQRESYILEKKEDEWTCTLCDYDHNIFYEPWDDSLNYDEYPPTNFEKMLDIKMPNEF